MNSGNDISQRFRDASDSSALESKYLQMLSQLDSHTQYLFAIYKRAADIMAFESDYFGAKLDKVQQSSAAQADWSLINLERFLQSPKLYKEASIDPYEYAIFVLLATAKTAVIRSKSEPTEQVRSFFREQEQLRWRISLLNDLESATPVDFRPLDEIRPKPETRDQNAHPSMRHS